MVKTISKWKQNVFCLLVLLCVTRVDACGELTPCETFFKLGKIKSITVSKAWASGKARNETSLNCHNFYLTKALVQYYFKRTGQITENANHYATPSSPCYASGMLQTVSGDKAEWYIGVFGEGELRGFRGRDVYLYCSKCKAPPFIQ